MSQTKITKQQREALDAALHALAAAGHLLDEIPMTASQRRHLEDHLQEACNGAQEAAGVEGRGRCESCDNLLVVGDLVHATEDAGNLCEDCAPTNGDVLEQYREIIAGLDSADEVVRHNAAVGVDDPDDLRERFVLLSAYSPEDLAKKALTELT